MYNSIFDYYKKAAKILGGIADADGTYSRQAAYSLYWFFCENDVDNLNPLTKTFLGDYGNHRKLIFGETLPPDLENYFLENALPNESQKLAVETALANAISFIQGPPGTGKTAIILPFRILKIKWQNIVLETLISGMFMKVLQSWEMQIKERLSTMKNVIR